MFKRIIISTIFIITSLSAQWPFGKDVEWYIEGPKKNWTKHDHDRYYRWRDRLSVSRKAEAADEQILPRQKAILNGNNCLLYTSPSPRDYAASRMPSSA